MNEYISKDYLHDKLSACQLEFLDARKYARAEGVDACMAIVFDAPTIKPRKHGRWQIVYYDNVPTLAACDKCDQVLRITRAFEKMPNYCPNCGAKMDEVENDT